MSPQTNLVEVVRSPYLGAATTVAKIRDFVNRSQDHMICRGLAEEICRELRSKDYLSEYFAIYHFVCSRTRYMRDPKKTELVKSPESIIQEIVANRTPNLDCDDMTVLMAALLMAVGAQVRIITVAFKNMYHQGERQFSHVFCQALDPRTRTWITLDPVASIKTKSMHNRTLAAKIWAL